MATREPPAAEAVEAFLATRHDGRRIDGLVRLAGGFWSSAFGYRVDGEPGELVVRFGRLRRGFELDRDAMAFAGPDLPVPEVLEIGDAFDGAYAISRRHYGRFLEDVGVDEADVVGPTIVRLLNAMRAVPPPPSAAPTPSWRGLLLDMLVDDRVPADLRPLHRACEQRVRDLLDACPERRDVVHGDLLHGNVLVSDDATRVTAVFSWKCLLRGDFLYDTAWCTFWQAFHPGIAAARVWHRMSADPTIGADAAARHHCYEVHVGARHLGWYAWTGERHRLAEVAALLAEALERGVGRSA